MILSSPHFDRRSIAVEVIGMSTLPFMVPSEQFDPATEAYVNLATYRRNGAEVRTPVWIAGQSGHYYVFSAGRAGKVKRIRATRRVRIAACDISGVLESDWIDGTARILSDPEQVEAARRSLRAKYGLQMLFTDFFSRLSGRFQKRAYLEITLNPAALTSASA